MAEVKITINGEESTIQVNETELKDLQNLVNSSEWEKSNVGLEETPYGRKPNQESYRISINGSGLGANIFSNTTWVWGTDDTINKTITSFFMQGNYFNDLNYLKKVNNVLQKVIETDRENWRKGRQDTLEKVLQFLITIS